MSATRPAQSSAHHGLRVDSWGIVLSGVAVEAVGLLRPDLFGWRAARRRRRRGTGKSTFTRPPTPGADGAAPSITGLEACVENWRATPGDYNCPSRLRHRALQGGSRW